MALTQSTLRPILAQILSVSEDFIVPKQGNWYNPQDSINSKDHPSTWLAYKIAKTDPVSLPYIHEDEDGPASTVLYVSRIELQFVGTSAEELAQSVAHWPVRGDVQALLYSQNMTLMACSMGSMAVPFRQDGLNDFLSYNVTIKIQWAGFVTGASKVRAEAAQISGNLIVP